MPELPDIELYRNCLAPRVVGQRLESFRLASPFLLRTVEPRSDAFVGRHIRGVERLGKRLVLAFDDEHFAVLHLMIAGRLRWGPPRRQGAGQDRTGGVRLRRRDAAPYRGEPEEAGEPPPGASARPALAALDPGGIELLDADPDAFRAALTASNNTLKRALTDPHRFAGIGNAYSDEILHHARLSPVALTQRLDDEAITRLYASVRSVLQMWIDRLLAQIGDSFPGPGEVTAFRPEMAVHGKFRQPCPICGAPVQRIVHAENETQLLSRLPDRRKAARRPLALQAAEGRLAAQPGRPGASARRRRARRRAQGRRTAASLAGAATAPVALTCGAATARARARLHPLGQRR